MTSITTSFAHAKTHSVEPNKAIRIKRAHDYPEQIWWLLTSFIGFLTMFHVAALVVFWTRKRRARRAHQTSQRGSHGEGVTPNVQGKILLRRIPLAMVNLLRILLHRITVPVGGGSVLKVAEVWVTLGYIVALFTWEFINCTDVTTGTPLNIKYWSNRAGTIVMSQLPLMVALAGKNNIISFLTGISYEKLNVLHRAAARVCLVLVWVHFWARVKEGLTGTTTLDMPWVRMGIANATAYTLLVLISFRPLRQRFYEIFFFSHFILVLMILVGSYFHIRRGFGAASSMRHDYGPYLIPAFVLWAFDRGLRLIRTIRNNPSFFGSSRTCDATAELLSPTMVRLVLTRKNMYWRAGQSAFITVPGVSSSPFEAHPFTIASIPDMQDGTGPAISEEKAGESIKGKQGNELVFLIRARNGFTKRLREVAELEGGKGMRFPLSVYVDGPYGSPPDVNAFTGVFLIAGGSGVSYTLPLLQDIVRNACEGSTACSSIFFLWAVPHHSDLSWISRPLHNVLEATPQSLQVRVRIHVTRGNGDSSVGNDSSSIKDFTGGMSEKLLQDARVQVETGRPDMYSIFEEELVGAQGPVSVDVAGPAALAADVRKALSSDIVGPKAVLKGGPDVTLHVETYGIA